MELKIRKTATGLFEIIKVQPMVVGSFPEKSMAEKVMRFLVEDILENGFEEPAALPSPAPLPEQDQTPFDQGWTDEYLKVAFERLEKGESCKEIAEDFGLSWTILRAKWAARKRLEVEAMPADIKEECHLCGRSFKPTPSRMDICARCANV